MRIYKKILNRDHGGETHWIPCAWADCERSGYELFKAVVHDHNNAYPCTAPGAKHVWYPFCTERHKQYWVNSHRANGNLPAGSANTL
jgi:hypothetical protein